MKNLVFGLLLFFVFLSPTASQDAQFYQVFASPLTLNPAMTGMIDGNFRISGVYRDQWRALVDKPFSTFAMSGDGRFSISKKRKDNSDYVGVGLYFQSDKVGAIAFTTNQLGISTAIHKSLDKRLKQYLSFGMQVSINQRNINYENLDFEDEFNGVNGFEGFTDASTCLYLHLFPNRHPTMVVKNLHGGAVGPASVRKSFGGSDPPLST